MMTESTPIPDFGPRADAAVREACELFPARFGLRAIRGGVFRACERASFVSRGQVWVYTERLVSREEYARLANPPRESGELWLAFAKGTITELQRELTPLAT